MPGKLRLPASWEPLGGSPEPPQLGPQIRGFGGKPPSGFHDAERQKLSLISQPKITVKFQAV